jgi:uncharacterized RDD family membrane protein YckC
MTHFDAPHAHDRMGNLPDPFEAPEFYDGVLPKRFLAWIVDVVLVHGATFVLGILTLTLAWWLWPLVALTLGFVYRLGTLGGGRSATWGMRLMGIELRDLRGDRFDLPSAALHTIGYYATLSFALPALASAAAMAITDRRQGLTDLVMGSAAINRPS